VDTEGGSWVEPLGFSSGLGDKDVGAVQAGSAAWLGSLATVQRFDPHTCVPDTLLQGK
jgi:hypothetical protein